MNREGRKWAFLANASAFVLVLITYFGLDLSSRAFSYHSGTIPVKPLATVHAKALSSPVPMRLEIPKIKVDAAIEDVGLTATGNMDVPANIADAGWYKYGSTPGSTGSAVIAGHLDGAKGQPGIFTKLNKLKPGDSIVTIDNAGHTTTFVVREIRTYNQDVHSSEIFTSLNGAHLNLITCTGSWDVGNHRFQQRLVVFADEV